ncbi:alpha-tectorin-like [Melanotaenia boesemani]|uniref:alpha-tectorin-like n=1 Tax=Melanotaenia boesemani TaxID=1250792 RepID=UPI001C040996|nr:alpha-tectorin-like [Melanotaenia boesemani]
MDVSGSSVADSTFLPSFCKWTDKEGHKKSWTVRKSQSSVLHRHRQTHLSINCEILREPSEQKLLSSSSSTKAAEGDWSPNMLHPLLYLSALIALTDSFTVNTEFNLDSCNITYYQQTYSKLYTNFTQEAFVICFDDFYNPQTSQDCIIGPRPRISLAFYSQLPPQPTYESTIQENVATISNNITCSVKFDMVVDGNNVAIILSSFGSESALELYSTTLNSVTCEVIVNAGVVETLVADSLLPNAYTDISGCRISEGGIKPNSLTYFPTTCTNASCSITRSVMTTGCGNQERCDGNSICLMMNTCTVTGPTIIDIHGTFNSVGDRCAYSLVLDSWVPGFEILAVFRERRRSDVSFLESLTLRFINSSTDVLLGQGGKVLVNDSLQTLNSTVQEVHGVELSKDQTGVHANVMLFKYFVFVYFDGNTAQINIEVPVGSALDGLCGNSNTFSSAKLFNDSSSGCEILYTEPADSTINCTIMTESCNILKDTPFSTCNTEVDPAPYITACSETLCKYPAVDGLKCQFLWSYARVCSLKNATLNDWWLEAGCSPPEDFCRDKFCSNHEFCGIKYSGLPGCLCRAVFASSYRESNTLGDPVVCTVNSASVSLVGCLLEEENIDYSLLHLNDETCKGEMDQESGMVTFSFNSSNTCGAVITANNTQVTYKNTITADSNSSDVIIRHYQFDIDFSCIIFQPGLNTMAFRVKDNSVVQHVTYGELNYTVTMNAYTNADRTQIVDSNTYVMLNQKIWMCLETKGLDANLISVVTDFCWATNQKSFKSTPRHDLIQNGCANTADQTVTVERNGDGTSSFFSFNMLQFNRRSTDVYLHCKLKLCVNEGTSCIPDCSGGARKGRSVHLTHEPEVFVTLAWSNTIRLFLGEMD